MDPFELLDLIRRYEEALAMYAKGMGYFSVEEYSEIILYYLENGSVESALRASEIAENTYPEQDEILLKKLEVLLELERNEESKILLDRLHSKYFDDIDYLICCAKYHSNLNEHTLAISFCKKALQYEEEESFLYTFIGDEYILWKKPEKAIVYYKLALQTEPRDEYLLDSIIRSWEILGFPEMAIQDIEKHLESQPFFEYAWLCLGDLYMANHQLKEALKAYDFALAISQDNYHAVYQKAICHRIIKNYATSLQLLNELLEIAPEPGIIYSEMASTLIEMENLEAAVFCLENAIEKNPLCIDFYIQLAEVLLTQKKYSTAEECLQQCIGLAADNPEFFRMMADAQHQLGKNKAALRNINQALSLDPDNKDLKIKLLDINISMNSYTAAKDLAIGYITEAKEDASIFWDILARIYTLEEREELALACSEKAKELKNPMEDLKNKLKPEVIEFLEEHLN